MPISTVPGPRQRARIRRATIGEFYSVGPLVAGSEMNITVWSYADQLNISVLTDDQTLDDPHEATDAMIRSFAAIRSATAFSGDPPKSTRRWFRSTRSIAAHDVDTTTDGGRC